MLVSSMENFGGWFDWLQAPQRRFRASLGASFGLHAAFWLIAWLVLHIHFEPPPVVEVDLNALARPRSPFDTRLPGAAKGAPAPAPVKSRGGRSPLAPSPKAKEIITPAPETQKVPEKEKPWILPGPNTKVLEKPVIQPPAVPIAPAGGAPGGTGVGGEGGRGGSGGGPGTGEAWVDRHPRLINIEEIRAALRRNYPMSERQAGRGGIVKVRMRVGTDGRVTDVRVVQSGGAAFDSAAEKVAKKMLFEPALKDSLPVSFPVVVPIKFAIEDR